MRECLLSLLIAVISYLLGCFSTGLTISKLRGVDLRKVGSKNTGASNVLRVMGLKLGVLTFIGDFIKAMLACWIGSLILPGTTFSIPIFGTILAGLFAIIGHNWPVFYGFKGGKGVACSAAVIVFINPTWGLTAMALWIALVFITRYISIASMSMLLFYAVVICILYPAQWFLWGFAVALLLLCVWRHLPNIKRLLNGTENKIGQKATAADETK
ncbi:MAG: glycerol-3-phosphate 1-O-acyltransferase PlsY [Clostridiales bacterium]|nr:glycerol-3-phosphate 1-O-acyltransferase PlsY [Clostridiales bacterium]